MLSYRKRESAIASPTRDAMIGFSLPLWFWGPSSMIREAKAEREMAEAELQAATVMTLYDVKNTFVKAQTAKRLVDLYQTSVIPQGEAALRVAETGYQAGKTGFLDLLDAQRTLLDFKLEYYQYIVEYQRWTAELERSIGVSL